MICSKTVNAFEITCILIAAVAVSLASFVYLAVLDQNGSSLLLFGAASVLAILMHGVCKVHDCASVAIGSKSDNSAERSV
jgi:hypothetical protein